MSARATLEELKAAEAVRAADSLPRDAVHRLVEVAIHAAANAAVHQGVERAGAILEKLFPGYDPAPLLRFGIQIREAVLAELPLMRQKVTDELALAAGIDPATGKLLRGRAGIEREPGRA
ncbi:MAG TPA: hypothetical protein VGK93_08235 [Candidatus Eisenbacteria bacterium]|jgi:hypothetical protein